MTYETIRLETDARGIARLTLNRPDKHNALNEQMMREITAACGLLTKDASVRAVVLAAEGASFCAGGDLSWMKEQAARDRAGKIEGAGVLAAMLKTLDELPKPVIARVHGNAFGGGIGMMAVADIVVAAEGVALTLTETRLGLIAATIGPYVVGRIGEGWSRRMLLSARRFGVAEALNMGLVSRVALPAELDAAVADEADAFLACAPGAVAHAKAYIRALTRGNVGDPIAFSAEALADRWETAETQAGIAAFLARRPMPWA
jgi:methylglutaconyl-CoA hydratase